jgi:hypothetical protein
MANVFRLIKSIAAILVLYLMAAVVEISCGGKGKGKGSDIILYKNNLVIRGEKGKGNLVIAGGHQHNHGHHEEHGGHHFGHEGGHHHHEQKFIMSVLNDSKGKGKGKGMGGGGGGGNMKNKGSEASWEDLIMGGGKY